MADRLTSRDVSVLVPTYARPRSLTRCLVALSQQFEAPAEIVVVVRGDDEVSRRVAVSGGARTVAVTAPGQVEALNAGLEEIRTSVVAITDDDTEPRPDWVANVVRRFNTDSSIGAVGGRDVVHHGTSIDGGKTPRVGRVRWFGRLEGGHHLESHLQDVAFLKGANMSFRREALGAFARGLRGTGAQVGNDLEASFSVHARAWRVVWDPQVVVDHHPAERLDEDGRLTRSLRAELDQAYNELFSLFRHARPTLLLPIFIYQTAVGTRASPGVALALASRMPGSAPGRTRVWGLLVARCAGAVEAIRSRWRDAIGTSTNGRWRARTRPRTARARRTR